LKPAEGKSFNVAGLLELARGSGEASRDKGGTRTVGPSKSGQAVRKVTTNRRRRRKTRCKKLGATGKRLYNMGKPLSLASRRGLLANEKKRKDV